jgi:hypothetical protein
LQASPKKKKQSEELSVRSDLSLSFADKERAYREDSIVVISHGEDRIPWEKKGCSK